jgi:hypothetical protein
MGFWQNKNGQAIITGGASTAGVCNCGNRIAAPAPIGGVQIDLTAVCHVLTSCTGTYRNVSAAYGGATSLSVSQILAYATSQSNAAGIIWYANVKATQELAKDTFDAINNQAAFAA